MEVDRQSATLLYPAAQELLSNVYKFAQASTVTVRLGCVTHGMSHGVQLKVTDDGGGFDVPAAMIARTRAWDCASCAWPWALLAER